MSYKVVNGKVIKKEKSMLQVAKQRYARQNKVSLKRMSHGLVSHDDDEVEYIGNTPRINFRVV